MRSQLFMLALVLVAGATVHAYPNLNATTGILAVPTANTVASGKLVGAADILFFDDTTLNGRAVFGLTDNIEVGAGLVAGEDTAVGLNIKYRTPLTVAGFNWAVGATVITGNDVDDGTQVYLAGTRPIGLTNSGDADLMGTVGVNFTDLDGVSGVRPFAGAQLHIGAGTEIAGEFVLETGDFDESIFSVVVRQQLTPKITGQAGMTNAFGFTGTSDTNLFIGAAYAFGE